MAVVIPAGGSGTRLGGRLPKQFLKIGGEPILLATVRRLAGHPSVTLVVVAAPGRLARARRVLRPLAGRAALRVVEGGAERQESVWRALLAVPEAVEVVLVHDAVRPFVTRGLIDSVLGAAVETGAAICARPIAETVKRVIGGWWSDAGPPRPVGDSDAQGFQVLAPGRPTTRPVATGWSRPTTRCS